SPWGGVGWPCLCLRGGPPGPDGISASRKEPTTTIARKSGKRRNLLPEDGADDAQRGTHLVRGDAERRAEADGTLAAAEQQQAVAEGRLDDLVAQGRVRGRVVWAFHEVHRHHQSHPADLADLRKLGLQLLQ